MNGVSSSSLFVLFQGESHYDEEKEIIQKQLKIERDELLVICQQHQVRVLSLVALLLVQMSLCPVHVFLTNCADNSADQAPSNSFDL